MAYNQPSSSPVAQAPNQVAPAVPPPTNSYAAPIYGGAATVQNATPYTPGAVGSSMNPVGTTQAPAVVTANQATTVANNAQASVNNKVATGAVIQGAKSNLVTTYDPNGNMVQTGGLLPNGTPYVNTIPKGAPGYIPNPIEVKDLQDKIATKQKELAQKQAEEAKLATTNAITSSLTGTTSLTPGQASTTNTPTYNNPSSVSTPSNLDPTTQDGQATWYNQDRASFDTWAKDQGITPEAKFQVSVLAGNQQLQSLQTQGTNALNQYLSGTYALTPGQEAQVAGLRRMWEGTINTQQTANKTYLGAASMASARAGGQYNPMGAVAAANRAIQTGLDRITVFQGIEEEAVNNMIQGFKNQNYKAVTENLDRQEKMQEAITANLKTVNDSIVKAKESAQTQENYINDKEYQEVTKPIQDVAASAATQGAPADIQAAINSATTVEGAIAAAGDYLQSGTGTLGDYLQYKRATQSKGLVPMDYTAFKDREDQKASQLKISEAYSTAYASAKGKNKADAEYAASTTNPLNLNGDYAGALQVILGSQKFTDQQIKTITKSISNGEDPFTVVKNQAKNIMGSNEATTLSKYEKSKDSMQKLDGLLKEYYAKGGKTNVFSGTYEKTLNKLGTVNNPELVDLATQIQAQLQVYRNAVSGTAYSEQEGKDIRSIFPGIDKTQGLNQAIINGRIQAFDDSIDGSYRTALGGSYDKLKTLESTKVDQAGAVNTYIKMHPTEADNIAKMYEIPGATDVEIYKWLKDNGKL